MATSQELEAILARKEKLARIDELLGDEQEPLISLPEGKTLEDIQKARDRAISQAVQEPEREQREFLQRGIETGRFSAEEEDPLGARRPIQIPFARLRARLTGRAFETPETRSLPRAGQIDISPSKDIQRAAAFMVAGTPEERVQMIKSIDAGSKARYDNLGNIIVTFSDGREGVLNPPGFDFTDALELSSEVAKFAPAARAATVPARIAGAGLTQTAAESAAVPLGGEFDAGEIALETALAGGGEALGPIASRFSNARRARRAGVSREELPGVSPEVAGQARRAETETGIQLFPAQRTQAPSQLERQSFISQLPAGTQTAAKALRRQNEQAATAVENFLSQIAPARTVGTAAGRLRTASQNAVELAKRRRSEFAKFGDALTRADAQLLGRKVEMDSVSDFIRRTILESPQGGDLERTFKRIQRFMKPRGERKFKTFKELQRVKKEIDGIIDKVGEGAVSPDVKMQARDVRDMMLSEMEKVSPDFKEARARFRAASPEVDRLEESVIGRIAKLDDTQLKGVTSSIFNPEATNVQMVRDAKKVIKDIDPDAWNQIVRAELENRLGKMKPGTLQAAEQGLTLQNVPQQLFSAVFGNEKQTKALISALDNNQARNIRYLQTALERARTGRALGSPTAGREEIKRELRGGVLNSIGAFLTPAKSLETVAREATFDKRVKAMAEALFDPKWQNRMEDIRKVHFESPKAARMFIQLLDEIDQSTNTEEN